MQFPKGPEIGGKNNVFRRFCTITKEEKKKKKKEEGRLITLLELGFKCFLVQEKWKKERGERREEGGRSRN